MMPKRFANDLLYAECSRCGQPVLLEPDQTADIILWSGLNPLQLDLSCMILSDGCPLCDPEEEYFPTHIVRLKLEAAHVTGHPLR
ncbi:hypothetical protein [Desulfocurvibacter africanus]|uniref:hypothetical protein n=1 Tax=Desulfocurvibacter africanus TaxID=873 RepID=UPI002FDA40F5